MPSNVRFAVLKKLLEGKGYVLDHVTGSHHIFKKPGAPNVNVPVHRNQVLYVYLKQAEKKPHDIHRPLPPGALERARVIAERYQLRVWREEGHWFGAGIEEPGTYGDGRTLPQCVRNVREALAVTVAWHVEDGEAVVEPIVDQQRHARGRKAS